MDEKLLRTPKLQGEWAEAQFLAKASGKGIPVAKPWGDCQSYDFIVELQGTFLRIQVKSTRSVHHTGGYRCGIRRTPENPYTIDLFDFVAAYIIPVDVWYIVPSKVAVSGRNSVILLSPRIKGHKYERYMEAWHYLLPPNGNSNQSQHGE